MNQKYASDSEKIKIVQIRPLPSRSSRAQIRFLLFLYKHAEDTGFIFSVSGGLHSRNSSAKTTLIIKTLGQDSSDFFSEIIHKGTVEGSRTQDLDAEQLGSDSSSRCEDYFNQLLLFRFCF